VTLKRVCTPVVHCILSQKRNVSLFRLPTVVDSVAFCTETTKTTTTDFPRSAGCVSIVHISLYFLLSPPVVDRQLTPYVQMRYVYDTSNVNHTHTLPMSSDCSELYGKQ
jgi:hypothetical protein